MGRRWGKSAFGIDYLTTERSGIAGALSNRPVAWFAPNYKYLGDAWRDAKAILRPVIVHKDETDHRMILYGGGSIEFWSLDGDDPARGRKYSKVIIDEAAIVRHLLDKWLLSIRPTLTDFRGGALFASTPKGRNDFRKLEDLLRQRSPNDSAFFHAPSSQNPFLHPGEIEAARNDLPELYFRQEYLAEYVDFGGALVRPDTIQHGRPDYEYPIVVGVDLAISSKTTADYTAISVISRDKAGRIFVLFVIRGRWQFSEILRQIEMVAAKFKPVRIMIENNQFQAAVVQELRRTTELPVIGVRRDVNKLTAFLPLAGKYENRLMYHSPDLPPYFEDELLAFTGTDADDHDDCVDSVVNALLGLPALGVSIASGNRRETSELEHL